jgi:hypothetical protein
VLEYDPDAHGGALIIDGHPVKSQNNLVSVEIKLLVQELVPLIQV